MICVLEPSEPAFRNGKLSRSPQASEENKSVGRRMVHLLLVILVLAVCHNRAVGALTAAHCQPSCPVPSGVGTLSGAQLICQRNLSAYARANSESCRAMHLRSLWHSMHPPISNSPNLTHLSSCLSRILLVDHCSCAWQPSSRQWQTEDVAARGRQSAGRRRKGLWHNDGEGQEQVWP